MRPYYLLAALIAISFVKEIRAQEYQMSFKILNMNTGIGVENAEIGIEPCRCGGVSDEQGRFSITLPEANYQVTVSYIGFASEVRHVVLNQNISLNIMLTEKNEELSEVIVRAKKMDENLNIPQMGVVRLTPKELKMIPSAVGESDVLRSMVLLPGVNNAGEISNGLSIRGGSLDQNLILYDYAPIFNPTHLFGLFSVFTPDAISSTELYRANIPSRYGGRATSVLDLKVKNPYVDKLKLTGGIGLVSSRLNVETPLVKDKLMLFAGVRAGFTDFLLPLFSERLKDTKARFYDSTLKLLYLASEKDQISLTGFVSKDFYQLDLVTQIQNVNAENNQYDFSTLNGTLNWSHSFSNNANLRTVLLASDYTPKIIFPERDIDNDIVYKSKINYLSFISEYSKNVSAAIDYYIGAQANRYTISPGALDPGTSDVLSVSLEKETSYEFNGYANIDWSALEKLSLSGGLRFSHFVLVGPYTQNFYDEVTGEPLGFKEFEKGAGVKTYNGIEPRLGLNWKLGETTSLKTSYARLNQYLQNIYNSTTPVPTSRWKTADPYVQPQKSDSYGLGLYKNLWNNELEVSLEGYYRRAQNVLTYRPGADFFLSDDINQDVIQGEGKAYGAELSFKKSTGDINGWVNYTWSRSLLRSQVDNIGDRINNNDWYPSDFDRTHVFNGTVNFETDKFNTWSINFTAQTGRPYTAANGIITIEGIDTPLFLERNNARLPVYHRLDFSWNIRGVKSRSKRWSGDWTFTIYNLYARKNPYSIYYTQRNGTENSEVFLNSPLGAYELSIINSPLISLTYNFVFQ
ncbi:TonB-dependent receptor [Flagellimonas sediminis]|uniref:TonB-dependent receptor n=1 Tax=Flagellimonas sediminis TaxID=2696468 RepID=A0A6I5KQ82_9FLAO|nr:TonB-dependent receptor [Allomuricauda sediminis]NDV42667.1 TonB-dependent receptor [Allomuricauda sediminis]